MVQFVFSGFCVHHRGIESTFADETNPRNMEVDTAGTSTSNGEPSVMAPAGAGGAAGAQVDRRPSLSVA